MPEMEQIKIVYKLNGCNKIPNATAPDPQLQSTQRELEFLQFYMSVGIASRAFVGHQLNDFIKSCTFGGLECDIDNG